MLRSALRPEYPRRGNAEFRHPREIVGAGHLAIALDLCPDREAAATFAALRAPHTFDELRELDVPAGEPGQGVRPGRAAVAALASEGQYVLATVIG